jgi:hypothetical protein
MRMICWRRPRPPWHEAAREAERGGTGAYAPPNAVLWFVHGGGAGIMWARGIWLHLSRCADANINATT